MMEETEFRELQSDERQAFLSKETKVLDRYVLADMLAESLSKLGPERAQLAERVRNCHRTFHNWMHEDCGARWATSFISCSCRLCPHDQRQRSSRLAHKWADVLKEQWLKMRHLVLAERNCELGELKAGIAHLWESWQRLRRMEVWEDVRGAIVAMEVTFNREKQTWHPHLHVLFLGSYIPFEDINAAWIRATEGQGRTSHISAVKSAKYEKLGSPERAIREVLKYVTKTAEFVEVPTAVGHFLEATYRCRFLRTYGCYYRLRLEDADVSGQRCPDCGQRGNIHNLGIIDVAMLSLDFDGVFRIKVPIVPHTCFPRAALRGG